MRLPDNLGSASLRRVLVRPEWKYKYISLLAGNMQDNIIIYL
ncbi:hypothetical protein ASZ90_009428 [hydrocarbon metagenome]|uniref:Uncharacterized protein n=1 Tax=hydrocarbon metagenome TaxID=938273 RepID=A0A0W8FIU1_9ZZZZ